MLITWNLLLLTLIWSGTSLNPNREELFTCSTLLLMTSFFLHLTNNGSPNSDLKLTYFSFPPLFSTLSSSLFLFLSFYLFLPLLLLLPSLRYFSLFLTISLFLFSLALFFSSPYIILILFQHIAMNRNSKYTKEKEGEIIDLHQSPYTDSLHMQMQLHKLDPLSFSLPPPSLSSPGMIIFIYLFFIRCIFFP